MKKIAIHVGLHKTGSSTFQVSFADFAANSDGQFAVVRNGLNDSWPFAHHALVERLAEGDAALIDAIKREVLASPAEISLITCEDFSYPISHGLLSWLCVELAKEFDIEVFLLFREHAMWLHSLYTEQVKRGTTLHSFSKYFHSNKASLRFIPIVRLLDSFGIAYRPLNYHALDLPNDLTKAICGRAPARQLEDRYNRSLSVEMVLFLREFYRSRHVDPKLVDLVVHNAHMFDDSIVHDGPMSLYTDTLLGEVRGYFESDRQQIDAILKSSGQPPLPAQPNTIAGGASPDCSEVDVWKMVEKLLTIPR